MARKVVITIRGFKTKLRFVVALPTLLVCLGGLCAPEVVALQRLPLQKKKIEIRQPAPMDKEFWDYDKKGNPIYWDPQPRVVPLGSGKYAFKWLGRRGRDLTLIYERPDAVDVVVQASALPAEAGEIEYHYEVRNLESSGLNLGGFVVQTFSPKARPKKAPQTHAGTMANFIEVFRHGRWFRFAPLNPDMETKPGENAVFIVLSPDIPGLLQCRAHGGTLSMKGVGEEPPTVLANLYLGHDAWPHGYTIGPDERLAKMGLQGRLNYLIIRLPQMLELGWIENQSVMQWYKEKLATGKAAEVRARAEADFKKNLITSEVLALMTYLTR